VVYTFDTATSFDIIFMAFLFYVIYIAVVPSCDLYMVYYMPWR
jgi:hypothetical protein